MLVEAKASDCQDTKYNIEKYNLKKVQKCSFILKEVTWEFCPPTAKVLQKGRAP